MQMNQMNSSRPCNTCARHSTEDDCSSRVSHSVCPFKDHEEVVYHQTMAAKL